MRIDGSNLASTALKSDWDQTTINRKETMERSSVANQAQIMALPINFIPNKKSLDRKKTSEMF